MIIEDSLLRVILDVLNKLRKLLFLRKELKAGLVEGKLIFAEGRHQYASDYIVFVLINIFEILYCRSFLS